MVLEYQALTTQDYIDLEKKYGANNYKPLDVVLTRGEGIWVWDVEGHRYLDFLSAYSAVNQGHAHPRILQALIDQAQRLPLTSRAFRNDQLPLLAKELCELTGYDKMIPMNSGAEAVETALKLARKWGYKVKGVAEDQAQIIVCSGNFQGRTISIISFSDEPQYRDGFGPFTPGFVTVPYGDLEALERAITPDTVAFSVEPIQGEAGVVMPPPGYLRAAADLCKQHNVLFFADEIQSGLGRSGKLFASDWEDVRPDMIAIGKALSGGFYPVSAVLTDSQVMDVLRPGDHGSTFGGNPLGAAVARMALRVLIEEGMIDNARQVGAYLLERLRQIASPHVKEVRGRGLLIGVELRPEAGGARRFCEALRAEGLLCKETHDHVIRFAPPLIITRAEVDWALERIERVLRTA
ncbi:MAG: ornithine--oxo-acid transaminase [Anaerolineae bacterium]|nr:ornithine--oxo-acid transaminase [Anaerolineae bacterium]MDW8172994.1 ornithine--oxo-acid transaminase [Anaerolineae bacterium]